ncbi:MAG: lactate utilization protein [Lachnospiraceae bacterium]|nr:lactate utilization protein [Lachnospiraceae bacterium]
MSHSLPRKTANANLAATMIKQLQKRNMEGYYCATAKEAVDLALSLMPEGASITWGGSMTIQECGLMDAVRSANYELIDRATANTPEESRALYGRMVCADYFLMSTNAISMDGELVNIDGNANRVACLCCGPANVIVIAGMNKVAPDLQSAVLRARNVAAPTNTVRLDRKTPCAVTGRCSDCYSPDCICSQIVITRRSSIPNRIKVILVDEELGY